MFYFIRNGFFKEQVSKKHSSMVLQHRVLRDSLGFMAEGSPNSPLKRQSFSHLLSFLKFAGGAPGEKTKKHRCQLPLVSIVVTSFQGYLAIIRS